jgi:hypothetical protein
MKKILLLLFIASLLLSLNACKKSTESFIPNQATEYFPLTVGKYITYKLDSLVFINFGTSSVTRSFEVKYLTDARLSDNLDTPAYRIVRFIRNTPSNPWVADATFWATNTGKGIDFTENNLRYQKLKTPVRDLYTWKGNSYIDTYSFSSNVKYLGDWDYSYDSVGMQSVVGSYTLPNTLKVDQRDEVIGNPNDPKSYSEINYAVEKYAAGIGLVYRKFLHTEYQPPTPGLGGRFVDGSYGVTLTMIDHN